MDHLPDFQKTNWDDSSVGMLLGYHLQWSSIPRVLGNDEQKERWEKTFLETNAFVGGRFYFIGDRGLFRKKANLICDL